MAASEACSWLLQGCIRKLRLSFSSHSLPGGEEEERGDVSVKIRSVCKSGDQLKETFLLLIPAADLHFIQEQRQDFPSYERTHSGDECSGSAAGWSVNPQPRALNRSRGHEPLSKALSCCCTAGIQGASKGVRRCWEKLSWVVNTSRMRQNEKRSLTDEEKAAP